MMSRPEAAAFVEALEEYSDSAERLARFSGKSGGRRHRMLTIEFNTCRERLIDRLCGDEGTQPTPRPL
jgi:hypothetical protein